MSPRSLPPSRKFPSTQWSVVVRAANANPEVRRRALEALLRVYWTPLLTHLVRLRRLGRHEAEDLLQGFVTDKLIEQDLFERASQGKGRLRTLLLTALDRYAVDQHRFHSARKRTPAGREELDPDAPIVDPQANGEVDSFDVDWARQTLARAVEMMRQECRKTGREAIWSVFEARVLRPALEGQEPAPHEDLARRLGLKSPAQTSEALISAKRIFLRCIRDAVAQYVVEPGEVDDEIRELKRILGSFRP